MLPEKVEAPVPLSVTMSGVEVGEEFFVPVVKSTTPVAVSSPSLEVTLSKSLIRDLALLIYAEVEEGLATGDYVY